MFLTLSVLSIETSAKESVLIQWELTFGRSTLKKGIHTQRNNGFSNIPLF